MVGKFAGATVLILVLLNTGCKDKPPEPVPVKGIVRYEDDKPVAEMILTFHPQDESNKNTRPEQVTNKEGKFSLMCVKGRYKITMVAPSKGQTGGYAGGPGGGILPGFEFPDRIIIYKDAQKTPWLLDVPENGKEDVVLTVKVVP